MANLQFISDSPLGYELLVPRNAAFWSSVSSKVTVWYGPLPACNFRQWGTIMTDFDPAAFVRDVNAAGGSYHRLDLGNGLIIDGEYDMQPYLPYYGFPTSMKGMKALDVGTASGFFAVEFERRGAEVTAIDIYDDSFFSAVSKTAGSKARYVQKNIYDLSEDFGQYDLVFCGSLLLHLRDIFGAVQCLRSVCKGQMIIATGINIDPIVNDMPMCEFVGQKATEGDYWVYWHPNMKGLVKMALRAGFSEVEEVSIFVLKGTKTFTIGSPHGVVRAHV